MLQKISEK